MSKHVSFSGTTNFPSEPQTSSILLIGQKTTTKRLSASCQQIVSEVFATNTAKVIVRSCLADSQLYPIMAGHKCNKVALCPSSLNADMALTVGTYIWQTIRPKTELPGLNVCDMHVPRSIIAEIPQTGSGQFIEMEADAEVHEDGTGLVRCQFREVHADGTKKHDNATCLIRYESKAAWTRDWSRYGHLVQNSIKVLHDKPGAHRMQSGLAYKVFESFVTYADKYRSMDEVIFDGLEGTAAVSFKTDASDYCGPYHLDGSCHLSGFLCNAYDEGDGVYISEGWDEAKIMDLKVINKPGGKLTNYVRMQSRPGHALEGDIYVFMNGEVAQVWEGVKFKRVPRRAINILLPPPKRG